MYPIIQKREIKYTLDDKDFEKSLNSLKRKNNSYDSIERKLKSLRAYNSKNITAQSNFFTLLMAL